MKTIYHMKVDEDFRPAIADIQETFDGKMWEITRINVPEPARGHGYGRQLLQTICADADALGETLILSPLATGRVGLTQTQLVHWYKRYGFQQTCGRDPDKVCPTLSCPMIRKPTRGG